MSKNHLERIKNAIKKAQTKGKVYYPCNDVELLNEWKDTENMNDKELYRHIFINDIAQDWN